MDTVPTMLNSLGLQISFVFMCGFFIGNFSLYMIALSNLYATFYFIHKTSLNIALVFQYNNQFLILTVL